MKRFTSIYIIVYSSSSSKQVVIFFYYLHFYLQPPHIIIIDCSELPSFPSSSLLLPPPPPPPPLVKHNRLRLCLYIVFLAPYLLPPSPPLSFVCPPSLPSSQQFDCSTCEQQKTCAPSNQCVLTPSSSLQQQKQAVQRQQLCLLQSLSHSATN